MWIGVLWAGLRATMWITHARGKLVTPDSFLRPEFSAGVGESLRGIGSASLNFGSLHRLEIPAACASQGAMELLRSWAEPATHKRVCVAQNYHWALQEKGKTLTFASQYTVPKLLWWHVCRAMLAQNVWLCYEASYEKCFEIVPTWLGSFGGSENIPQIFPPKKRSPMNFVDAQQELHIPVLRNCSGEGTLWESCKSPSQFGIRLCTFYTHISPFLNEVIRRHHLSQHYYITAP